MTPSDAKVIAATRRWVRDIVVGLNLCPFAHHPFNRDTISYRLSRASEPEGVYVDLLLALEQFLHADPAREATGLFICPDALGDFEQYNEFLDLTDDILRQGGLEGWVQIASFHPDYRFADVDPSDAGNYTNRSPFPMFHFIREEELALALEGYPDPHGIPARNIALLRDLGTAALEAKLAAVRAG
jgi:hypothetical protein